MPISVSWYEPDRIIFLDVQGDVGIDELQQCTQELNRLFATGTAPVHIITDARQMGKFPTKLLEVRKALSELSSFGMDIIIGFDNPVARFLASAVSQMSRFEVRLVKDKAEAIQIISRIDSSLAYLADEPVKSQE